MITSLIIFLLLGALVGVLSGLLGVGGGIVIVPVMIFSLKALGFDESVIMKLSLGTSFSTIMITSISSVWSQHKRGAIEWRLVKQLAPSIIVAGIIGGLLVSSLPNYMLRNVFAIFLGISAIKMGLPNQSRNNNVLVRVLSQKMLLLWGCIIGFISALVGIGGGALTVPFLTALGHDIRKAIATSAAIGFPIAVTGTIVSGYSGWNITHWELDYSIGYIYVPGAIGIVATSVLFAPFGVRLAHTLPTILIKRIFAVFLLAMFIKLLFGG